MLRPLWAKRARLRRRRQDLMLSPLFGCLEALEDRTLLSGHAHDGDHVHAVFAPDTPEEYVFAHSDTPVSDPFAFQLTGRWSTTATNGGGLGQGDPTVLTWSIAPDGTSIPGFVGEPAAASDLVAFLGGIYGVATADSNYTDEPWFNLFVSVFDRWSELSGVTYVYEPNDDGTSFSNISSVAPGVLGVRGDVRIGGHFIDGNSGILAYNFFPNNGEMVIDTADNFYSNLTNNSLRLRNVLSHEAGHGLGFRHVESNSAAFLMEPFINTSFDGPQYDDVLAVNRHYGDGLEDTAGGNDTSGTATPLGLIPSNTTVTLGTNGDSTAVLPSETDFLSIDGSADLDYFSFSLPTATTLTVTLDPLGPTYNQGPQNGSQSPFNAQSQEDLTLQVIDSDGTTVLDTANATGLGGSEVISDLQLGAGTYFVRVSPPEINAAQAAQTYRLSINNAAIGAIQGTKFNDLNGNGIRDAGEPGLEGWTIYMDENENQVFDILTGGLEPDDFDNGENLSKGNDEVDLTEVDSNNNFIGSNITAGATTFTSTGQPPSQHAFFSSVTTWRNTNRLRMQFSVPVTSVSIDAIADDTPDIGQMEIYDAGGNLLDTYVTGNIPVNQFETMTLSSTTPIAYAIAWGPGGQFLYLDNLRYSFEEPSTITDADGDYSFPIVANGTHQLGEILQADWIQTSPRFGRLFAVAFDTNEILEIDPTTGAELNRFSHPGLPANGADGLAFDGRSLFFTDRVDLYELDPDDGTVRDTVNLAGIGAGPDIDALGVYDRQVVAMDFANDLIHYIDPTTDSITSTVPLSASIDAVGGLAGATSRGSLFVTDLTTNLIHEIDAATGTALNSFSTLSGASSFGLAFVDGVLFVGDTAGDITKLDPDTGASMGTASFGAQFSALGGDGGVDRFWTVVVAGQTVAGVDFGNVMDTPVALSLQVNSGGGNSSGVGQLTARFNLPTNVTNPTTGLDLFNHTTEQLIAVPGMTLENNGSRQVTWNLNGFDLPDGRYTAELHKSAATGVTSGKNLKHSLSISFHKLAGDLTRDGLTNASDFVAVDAFFDPLPGLPYRPGDANGDGLVNASDFTYVDAQFNPIGVGLGPELEYDFGDATEAGTNYRTTLLNDGARHVITGNTLILGVLRDAEGDGQPNLTASGDEADEDGVIITGNGGALETGTSVAVDVFAGDAGFLNAWIDYNLDGDWDDADEQVFIDQFLVPGVNNLSITAPVSALVGTPFARFRLTVTPGYSYFGMAPDGEVEDYLITVNNNVPPSSPPGETLLSSPNLAVAPAEVDGRAPIGRGRHRDDGPPRGMGRDFSDEARRHSDNGESSNRVLLNLSGQRLQAALFADLFTTLDGEEDQDGRIFSDR